MAEGTPAPVAPPVPGLIWRDNHDRDLESQTELKLMNMVKAFQEWCVREARIVNGKKYVRPITDSEAIGEIAQIYHEVSLLCDAYKETVPVKQIDEYCEWLTLQHELDGPSTLNNLRALTKIIAEYLKRKHKFMDRTDEKKPWDREIKKKLEIRVFPPEVQQFYDRISTEWKKFAFLLCWYVVVEKGDAHILDTGPNNSGKTNTALCFLRQCNYYLINMPRLIPSIAPLWQVSKYNDFWVEDHPECANIPLDRFKIKNDCYVVPDPEALETRFNSGQFQCIDVNEGMEAATNVQSQKKDVVRLGINRFTSRSYHNIIVWEYQVQHRSTAMMVEGMNFWMQKMKKRHFILSMPSSLVRKRDPFSFKELDKCKDDDEIGDWMVKQKYYIHTFRAPRLNANNEKVFARHYNEQKLLQKAGTDVRTKKGLGYELMIQEMWEKVNKDHTMSILDLEGALDEMGYNKKDKDAFMRDYGKFGRVKSYEKWNKKATAGAVANG